MLSQKLLSIFLLLLLFLPGVLFTLTGGWEGFSLPDLSSFWDGTAVQPVENAFSESFVGRDFLCGATATLQTALGRNELGLSKLENYQVAYVNLSSQDVVTAKNSGGTSIFAIIGQVITKIQEYLKF